MNQLLSGSTPLLFLQHQVTNHVTILHVVVNSRDGIIFSLFLAFNKWHLLTVIIILFIMSFSSEHFFARKTSYNSNFQSKHVLSFPMPPRSYPTQSTAWLKSFSFSFPHTVVEDSSSIVEITLTFESARYAFDTQHHHLTAK